MRMKYCFPVIMQKDGDGYAVWVPDLEGCNSYGETVMEALEQVKDAIGLCIEMLTEKDVEIPEPSAPETLQPDAGQFVGIVEFDWMEYQKKYRSKAVKKTLTIPMYLNDLAMKEHINFSAVLQEALIQRLR